MRAIREPEGNDIAGLIKKAPIRAVFGHRTDSPDGSITGSVNRRPVFQPSFCPPPALPTAPCVWKRSSSVIG